MLEVRNLAFSYGRRSVLRDVSFSVSPGEIVGIVGANGAGKTTLLRILATLVYPDGGRVACNGVDAFARPLRYRKQMGYLAENPALYEDMTVKKYLDYRAHLKGEADKRIRRRVTEAAALCRISSFMRSAVRHLSAGMKRRVALADALMLRPRVLLLDDFLAGLDYSMRESAGAVLSEAAAFSSVIVTGHEIEDMAKFVTRFLVIKDGVVAKSISLSEVGAEAAAAEVRKAMEGVGK